MTLVPSSVTALRSLQTGVPAHRGGSPPLFRRESQSGRLVVLEHDFDDEQTSSLVRKVSSLATGPEGSYRTLKASGHLSLFRPFGAYFCRQGLKPPGFWHGGFGVSILLVWLSGGRVLTLRVGVLTDRVLSLPIGSF